jgi:hypothetical protein
LKSKISSLTDPFSPPSIQRIPSSPGKSSKSPPASRQSQRQGKREKSSLSPGYKPPSAAGQAGAQRVLISPAPIERTPSIFPPLYKAVSTAEQSLANVVRRQHDSFPSGGTYGSRRPMDLLTHPQPFRERQADVQRRVLERYCQPYNQLPVTTPQSSLHGEG